LRWPPFGDVGQDVAPPRLPSLAPLASTFVQKGAPAATICRASASIRRSLSAGKASRPGETIRIEPPQFAPPNPALSWERGGSLSPRALDKRRFFL
jgi:hypothetical protein